VTVTALRATTGKRRYDDSRRVADLGALKLAPRRRPSARTPKRRPARRNVDRHAIQFSAA
jgi:hypothetical protein